jgi:hypothetical protein
MDPRSNKISLPSSLLSKGSAHTEVVQLLGSGSSGSGEE